jgi:heme oxygenase (biliverdin-IX-beta and delta-forming)
MRLMLAETRRAPVNPREPDRSERGPLERAGPTGTRDILRQATHAAHQRLHEEPHLATLVAGAADRCGLQDVYARLYGFYHPLEEYLQRSPHAEGCGLDLHERARSALLRVDLASLGVSEAEIDRLPLCGALPELTSPAALVGCVYVLDGSRLGGKVIARALAPLFPDDAAAGRCFFLWSGKATGRLWRETCETIEQRGLEPGVLHDMIRSARATFTLLEQWLKEMSQSAPPDC